MGMLILIFCVFTASAENLKDSDALRGVTTGKVVWDIGMDNPAKLAVYLKVIQETYNGLIKQNVTPDMIFAFHGGAVKLISTDRETIPLEKFNSLDKIAEILANMQKKPGVKMEVCGLATSLFNVKNSTILPGIKPVANTYVSLIGYHTKGYTAIPIY
jgi:intracellular sulfur oxidation DsrE/DsrF family protein